MPTEIPPDQSFESILPEEEPQEEKFVNLGKIKIKHKTLYFLGGALFVLLVVLLAAASLSRETLKPLPPAPTPTATPTAIEEKVASPSAYATDSAILRIEGEIGLIEEKLTETDLKEAGLNPPVLDMKVDFKE